MVHHTRFSGATRCRDQYVLPPKLVPNLLYELIPKPQISSFNGLASIKLRSLHNGTSLHSKNVVQQYCCVFLVEVKPQWTAHPSPALANISVASQDTTHVVYSPMVPEDSCTGRFILSLPARSVQRFSFDRVTRRAVRPRPTSAAL